MRKILLTVLVLFFSLTTPSFAQEPCVVSEDPAEDYRQCGGTCNDIPYDDNVTVHVQVLRDDLDGDGRGDGEICGYNCSDPRVIPGQCGNPAPDPGTCDVVRVPISGGRGVRKEIVNNCSDSYQPNPIYGTTDRCVCIPQSTPVCPLQANSCVRDANCQSAPGCTNFVCLGAIPGRTPGKCVDKATLCSEENTPCAEDVDCQFPGGYCSNFYCWPIGKGKACKFGPAPFSSTTPTLTPPPNPCSADVCKTAIGPINTNPKDLISFLLRFLLGIAGAVAVLLIIYSGYRMMTSAGNPEVLQGARETLTSAIVGLLFIIFSLVLLEVIGVDILKIPGFR